MPPAGNKSSKSESAPSLQPSWPPWLKTWRWLAGITVLLLASSWLLPAIPDERQPLEQYLLRGIGIDMRSYSWEHNGLWHTNWNQMTNTVFHSGPRLQQSIFLPDHYVFIPHNQNWEITPRNSGSRLRIVMLRTSPTTRKGNATLGRYAIVFYPSADPVLREFEVKWFRESEITNLLAQSGHSLPTLEPNGLVSEDKDDSQ